MAKRICCNLSWLPRSTQACEATRCVCAHPLSLVAAECVGVFQELTFLAEAAAAGQRTLLRLLLTAQADVHAIQPVRISCFRCATFADQRRLHRADPLHCTSPPVADTESWSRTFYRSALK